MSSVCQIFVPVDMYWIPSKDAAEATASLLRSISSDTDGVTFQFFEKLGFADNGGNWSGVRCPACETELEDWFWTIMKERWESGFEDLTVVTPCCSAPSSLDALHFGYPVAFCSFSLSMLNSPIRLSEDQIALLEECLGSKLQLIWRRI